MRRRLPPLKALHAFEAAARLLSFTRAAEELGVTQGAVSKQISLLEEYLGVRLSKREGKQMLLTPRAEAYLPAISGAFENIAGATGILAGDKAGESLTVPDRAIHNEGATDKGVKLSAVYVLEKGKPLASPAP